MLMMASATKAPPHAIFLGMRRRIRRLARRVRSYFKLISISPIERRHLVRAQVALVYARFLLSTRQTGRLVSPNSGEPIEADPNQLPHARALALAIRRASVFGLVRPTCLVQSMALISMLRSDGLEGGRIRIGVRDRGAGVEAHAWVEFAREVIGDFGEHVATFTELTDVELVTSGDS